MPTAVLDAPTIASRFAHASAGQAQAEVLREAFYERDRAAQAHEQSLQEQAKVLQAQAKALQVLQDVVQKLQADGGQTVTKADVAAQAQHQEERTDGKFETLRAEIKADFAKTDAKIDLLRKDTEAGFAKADAKIDLLRKDMEAMGQRLDARLEALQNNLIIKLGGMMVLILGAGAALVKMLS